MKKEWDEYSMADLLLMKYILLAPNETLDFHKECAFITLDEIMGFISIKIKIWEEIIIDEDWLRHLKIKEIIKNYSEEHVQQMKDRVKNYDDFKRLLSKE